MIDLAELLHRDMPFRYGHVEPVSRLIRRVMANNPSPFTLYGTASFIVGRGEVCVIDPGPNLPDHIEALVGALAGEKVRAILVTHTHRDHSPAARPLAERCGAEILAFGRHGTTDIDVAGGADLEFIPDRCLLDSEIIAGPGWTLQAVHCPGHTSNHLCFAFAEERALFSGDHVMGWASTVILPPDGDMAAYRASLHRLRTERQDDDIYWPTHGPPIKQPMRLIDGLIAHRAQREDQLVTALHEGDQTIEAMVRRSYPGLAADLRAGAGQSVLAHLIELHQCGVIHCDTQRPGLLSRYGLLT